MKSFVCLLLLSSIMCLVPCAAVVFSADSCQPAKVERMGPPELDISRWKLVFDCEFDGVDDLQKWNKQDQTGQRYNNELQAYVTDAFHVKDGCLLIEAQKRDAAYSGEMMHYTSGRLNTRGKFDIQYGRFEIRLKVPAGRGFWPAFWLLPASGEWPPEIDFLEVLGHQPERMYFTNHWPPHKNGKHPQYGRHFDADPDFAETFHVVTGVWNEREIRYYVDGKRVVRSTRGIPHEKMYLVLNLAVGGDWPGAPDSKTVFPNNLVVDYVRVYEALPRTDLNRGDEPPK
jgi:beta-glucanase (GH16 family)